MVSREQNLRKTQGEKRRRRILNAALTLFSGKGFASTTVSELAYTAGVSVGLMYRYFPSKEKLLEAVAEQYNFLPQIREIVENTGNQSYRGSLRNIVFKFLGVLKRKSLILRVYIQESGTNTRVQEIWSDILNNGVCLLQRQLSERVKTGELKSHNTEVTARCLVFSFIIFNLNRDIINSGKIKTSRFVNEMMDSILKGIENKGVTNSRLHQ